MIQYKELKAEQIASVAQDIAHLRIEVFREYPYLYQGDMTSEQAYIENLSNIPSAYTAIATSEEGETLGAITCYALSDAQEEVVEAFKGQEVDLASICYFGEVVLLKNARGEGVGRTLIDMAEQHAHVSGYRQITLCTVDRETPEPEEYLSIHQLLERRGFKVYSDVKATMRWLQTDGIEHENTLTFWHRTAQRS